MTRVTVLMNNGQVKTMESRFARALVHCKKAVFVEDYEKKVIHSGDYEKKSQDRDELLDLRAKYQEKFGKRPFHGWNVDQLKEKIKEENSVISY